MAIFGQFQFGTNEFFGTSSGGGGVGSYVDYTVVVAMNTADETLASQTRIEVQAGTKWDAVVAAEWIVPATDNARADDRPIPHPQWP